MRHPTYFYDNQWYYRDRDRWRYYRTEPAYLQQRRARAEREWLERRGYRQPGYQQPPPPPQPRPYEYEHR